MNKIFSFILIIFLNSAISQVDDSFEYNDLNSSIWSGDLNFFQISDYQLQSNGLNLTNQKIYLSTPNLLIDSTEWQILIDLRFNPTSTTFVRIYLTSDQPNLKQPLNGYYIQYGETNQDFLRFGRQHGTSTTVLFTGNQSFSGNIKVRVKVTRDKLGNWEFFTDRTGGYNFVREGKITDNVLTASQYFGIFCEYSTASRYNLYYFDDIIVRNIIKDTIKPTVQYAKVINRNAVEVKFSEFVEKNSAENTANYSIQGYQVVNATRNNLDSTSVLLILNPSLENSRSYSLMINGVKDLAGNEISPNYISSFLYFIPFYRSLIINELMVDPYPTVGLPNAEYIEIYNPNTFNINIGNWKLSKGITDITLPNAIVPANGYLILCSTENVRLLNGLGTTLGVPSIPTLVNTGDRIILKSPEGMVIDEVNYNDSWYRDTQKKSGGWSLELVNPYSPCTGGFNWKASIDPMGGTPGKINSVYDTSPDTKAPNLVSYNLKGKDSLLVIFDEPVDTLSIRNLTNYYVTNNSVRMVAMENDLTRWWVLLLESVEVGIPYQMKILNIKDCAGNLSNGFHIFFGKGKIPEPGDVLITEIMVDESPPVGLPEAEYLEVWNASEKVLSLDGVFINDGSSSRAFFPSGALLMPNEYAIVCASSSKYLFSMYGKVLGLASFPVLTNTGKSLYLLRTDNTILDEVTYSDTWYRNIEKKNGGWALEMINPELRCLGGLNWTASIDSTGGTPGRKNSVFSNYFYSNSLTVTAISLRNDSSVVITFSQPVDTILAAQSHNYEIEGLELKSIHVGKQSVSLSIEKVIEGRVYNIKVKDLKDCVGNLMNEYIGYFGKGREADKFELMITEIMADESPSVGLPETEYVEIYNATESILTLDGVSFCDNGKCVSFPSYTVIYPDEYIIVTNVSKAISLEQYGRVIGLSGFPSLTNSGKLIYLYSRKKGILHAVEYGEDWHTDYDKKEGGWSLEMIDPKNPCHGKSNWTSSVHVRGGTPGEKNSVYHSNPDLTPPTIVSAFALNKNNILLKANESLDSLSIMQAGYIWIQNEDYVTVGIQSKNIFNDEILLETNFDLKPKSVVKLHVSGLKDCVGNVMDEKTFFISLIELDEKGDVLLSEILFDPPVGGSDFVEIYNSSNKYINLNGWSIARLKDGRVDSKSLLSDENLIIKPGQYFAFTDNARNIKTHYPRTPDSCLHQLKKMPAFLADSSTVLIFNNRDSLVQKFKYDKKFHHPMVHNPKGVSLERISFQLPENSRENWHSAAASAGYATPGLPNSQLRKYDLEFETNFEVNPKVITPDDDGINDFTFLNYKFDKTGYMCTIYVLDSKGRIVKHLARNELMGAEGVYKWDGSDDYGNKAQVGYYIFNIELFHLNGNTQIIRRPIAVYFKGY